MRIGIDASRAFVASPTGTERYAYEVVTRMLKLPEAMKHTWVLYTKPSNFQFSIFNHRSIYKLSNVQITKIPLPYLWTQVGLAWRTWVDDLDVLWVPAHTLPLLRQPGWLRKGRPLKTIVTIHGLEYEWLPAYENWLQRWYLPLSTQYAVHSAHKIIAVSEFTRKQLIERLNADRRKIKVILEGFDPQVLNSKSEVPNKSQILNKYKIKLKQYLLFVGTVQPRKNLIRLIEVFARLKTQNSRFNLKLVIAGKLGWMYDEILAAPKKFGVEERVIFTGYVNDRDRQALLANAVVYIQPSITEGFGLPVLEAMAAGVPVVSSNGGALAEVVGDAGILFDPLDTDEMVRSLEFIVHSWKDRLKLIKKGRERVKKMNWEKTARETLGLIVNGLDLIV
jgi:glycosyltransferase involved in cell wall biosynthesis